VSRAVARAGFVVLLLAGISACAPYVVPPPGAPEPPEPLRISHVAGHGDPARRASQRLVLEGLDADARGRVQAALGQYERALQVDPTNPFAYLALARHEVQWGSPHRALEVLAQAETLLSAAAGVEAHLVGLRGAALMALGRSAEAAPLLTRARSLAPQVWADGRLDASELR
jgi:tetratricopeptide (TPR) repeat protein